MSTQIKITRTLRSESQPLTVQDYHYIPPIPETVVPTSTPAKVGLLSPFLMTVNGFFFGACLLTVMFLQGQLKEANLAFVSWTIVLSSVLFAVAFVIGAFSSLVHRENDAGAAQKIWCLGFTLLGMLFMLFSMFIVLLG